MKQYRKAKLILEDGSVFTGYSFGHEGSIAGEIVFNTAMTGYPESLTDPSYKGQILVLTYPSIGNYGVPDKSEKDGLPSNFESEMVHISALIISDYSSKYNHWNASKSLGEWLKQEGVPGLFGIDTRLLTKHIREKGSMLAKIEFDDSIEFFDPNKSNLVEMVSCNKTITYGNGDIRILLIDCGVKYNIIRYLQRFNATIIRVPWDHDITNEDYDGLFISNGPGDPSVCDKTINSLRYAINRDKPIFGICLGHQLLAIAAGASSYKLKFGHRAHNQPVQKVGTNKSYLTSQNHGYAINGNSIPTDWKEAFINLNDYSNEGISHKSKPFSSTQFHPEASSGPTDTAFLFNSFIDEVLEYKKQTK